MQCTKFEGHQPAAFEEDNFEGILPYMGMGASLVTCPGSFKQTLISPSHEALRKIWFRLAQRFLRRRRLKMLDDDDAR